MTCTWTMCVASRSPISAHSASASSACDTGVVFHEARATAKHLNICMIDDSALLEMKNNEIACPITTSLLLSY